MQLVSYQFVLFFLPLSMAGRWLLPWRWARAWLLFCSYVFAYTWGLTSVSLLLAYTAIGWLAALGMEKHQRRKKTIFIGTTSFIVFALLLFKYLGLFVSPKTLSTGSDSLLAEEFLPLGISFYTFVLISYLVKILRGHPAEKKLSSFSLHMAFFPKLVAGPITRPEELLDRLNSSPSHDKKWLSSGMDFLLIGLVKKLVVADGLSPWVDLVFSSPREYSSLAMSTAIIGFSFQIYYDFSGYTDMARGAAYLLGFELPENFRLPYFATNPRDFWHRWHMTLSRFLKDYLYIPLGGNRRGTSRTYFNLMTTMVLGGLWHGVGLHFVIWGAYHGFMLILNRAWNKMLGGYEKSPRWRSGLFWKTCSWFLCFISLSLGWVFFRSSDLSTAMDVFSGIMSTKSMTSMPEGMYKTLVILAIVAIGHVLLRLNDLKMSVLKTLPQKLNWWARGIFWTACCGLLYLFAADSGSFIYRMF